jgi:crotonobetainyl-CoA:carnitine CoA-transferase CaiB-like acyl-CoA transferase
VRERLQIDVEEIRARNPQIIYVRGTGQGELGPDADKGAYDSLAFWARSGAAMVCMRPEFGEIVPGPPGSGFGDSIGAMTIAGGIMGALYHRERTGEAKTVDVSLFGAGLWAMGQSIAMSVLLDVPLVVPEGAPRRLGNPMVASYRTSDGRFVALTCLQAAKYWPSLCRLLGREDLAVDPRFGDDAQLWANGIEGGDEIAAMFAQRPLAEWRTILEHFDGQWAVVQHTLEAANDPQTVANGYLQDCESASGVPFKLVAAPVQFDEAPAVPSRSPEFNEHGDDILQELGLDWDAIIDLKLRGVVA